jgi:hypothetical protein
MLQRLVLALCCCKKVIRCLSSPEITLKSDELNNIVPKKEMLSVIHALHV